MPSDEFDDLFRRHLARMQARLSQALVDFHEEYESMDQVERQEFTSWINDLAQSAGTSRARPTGMIILGVHIELAVARGTEGCDDSVMVPVLVLQKAVAAWNRGQPYPPTAGDAAAS